MIQNRAGFVAGFAMSWFASAAAADQLTIDSNPVRHETEFPCAAYSAETAPNLLPRLRQAGISILGPGYDKSDLTSHLASEQGFNAIATIDTRGLALSADRGIADLSDFQRRILALSGSRAVVGWYVLPEEPRPWRKDELERLQLSRDAIKRFDPLHRPVFVYAGNNRDATTLSLIGEHVDVILRGTYPNYAGFGRKRAFVNWSMQQMVNAQLDLASKNHSVKLWPVLEMFADPPQGMAPINDLVRHDVFSALLGGSQGIALFSLWRRPNFDSYDEYLNAYLETLRQVCGAAPLGKAAMIGELRRLPSSPSIPRSVFELNHQKHVVDGVQAGLFTGREGAWLIIVNSLDWPVQVQWDNIKLPEGGIFPSSVVYSRPKMTLRANLGRLKSEVVQFKQLKFED